MFSRSATITQKSVDYKQLEFTVMRFRVQELRALLSFAGYQKSGLKKDLQTRAIELVRLRSPRIAAKVREIAASTRIDLSKTNQHRHVHRPLSQVPVIIPRQTVPNTQYTLTFQSTSGHANATYPLHDTPEKMCDSLILHPNVKLKKLPFSDILDELLQPSLLLPRGSSCRHEENFVFQLTTSQANSIGINRQWVGNKMEYKIKVQMRFCLTESLLEQVDNLPLGIAVKVNGIPCKLPLTVSAKLGFKKSSQPVDITSLIRISPLVSNIVTISWIVEQGKTYATAIHLVHQLTCTDLLSKLMTRIQPENFTVRLIQGILKNDLDCKITSQLKASLLCPLGKVLMSTPCRASTCNHLQCFDASRYLQMNERKPTWICPVCNKPADFDNLVIDSFFNNIIKSDKIEDCKEVQLHPDGSWSCVNVNGQPKRYETSTTCVHIEANKDNQQHLIAKQPLFLIRTPKDTNYIDLTKDDSD